MLIATFDFNVILFTIVIIAVVLFLIFRMGGWFKKK